MSTQLTFVIIFKKLIDQPEAPGYVPGTYIVPTSQSGYISVSIDNKTPC